MFERSTIGDQPDKPKPESFTRLAMKLMEDGLRKQQPPELVFRKKGMGTENCKGNQFFRRKQMRTVMPR